MSKPLFGNPLIKSKDHAPEIVMRNRPALVITIPLDRNLPKDLSPNARSRSHWPRTNAVAQARLEGAQWTRTLVDPNDPYECFQTSHWPLVLHVVVARGKGARALDDDNCWACIKPYRDGIAEVLGVDDRNFRQGVLSQVKSETGSAYMRIAIEPADVEEVAA